METKIISLKDLLGDFSNGAVRKDWIIEQLLKIPKDCVLLDAGAGEMQYEPYCRHLKYIAQDFGKYDPKEVNKGLKTETKWDTAGVDIICDIIDMPLDSDSVDVILCSEVFEHLKNPILALKEFARILKPGGGLLLTAPFCSLVHMAPYHFSSGFSEFWYQEHLKDCGFEIEEMKPYGNYFKWLSQELFRTNEMAEEYCGVKLDKKGLDILKDSIRLMSKLAMKDKGSDGVLCFGYLVKARKL